MKGKGIYTIQYYEKDKYFGWTNTVKDKVFASSKEEAEEKFKKKHPDVKTFTTVDWLLADY